MFESVQLVNKSDCMGLAWQYTNVGGSRTYELIVVVNRNKSYMINSRVFNFANNQFLVDQLFITPTPVTSTQLLKSTQYYKAF